MCHPVVIVALIGGKNEGLTICAIECTKKMLDYSKMDKVCKEYRRSTENQEEIGLYLHETIENIFHTEG